MDNDKLAALDKAAIKHMAERFLSWKLPADFNPDDGISFEAEYTTYPWPTKARREPTGTNLFDYTKAEAMVRYMVEGLSPVSLDADTAGLVERLLETKPRYDQNTGEHMFDVFWNRDGEDAATALRTITAERDALAKRVGDADEYGWLIEHQDEPKWLTLRSGEAAYFVCWTTESNEALRFARRSDAEDYASSFLDEGPIRITDHIWTPARATLKGTDHG